MAGGAAKKAAAARNLAKQTYLPLILVLNGVYLASLFVTHRNTRPSYFILFCIALCLGMQYFSYTTILENAVRPVQGELVGGAALDVWAVTTVIQFGALYKTMVYAGLWIFPVWGAWHVYSTMKGSDNKTTKEALFVAQEEDPAKKARREKRAEKRRQKW